MALVDHLMDRLDAKLVELLSGWSYYTTVITLVLVTFVVYPLLTWKDPDTHPLLLARQSYASPVRQEGESAIYRSLETPHSYPLKSGLGVKDPGAAKWASGRDGDLRDIWMKAAGQLASSEGQSAVEKSTIITFHGDDELVHHDVNEVTREINIIGGYIEKLGIKNVAIYLPNSIELLAAIFAASFYGLKPILIPQNQSPDTLIRYLQLTKPEFLIAAAGALPLAEVAQGYHGLKQIMWVVKGGNRQMDWNEVPEGIGGKIEVSVWHEVIDSRKDAGPSEIPSNLGKGSVENIVTIWQPKRDEVGEVIEFTHKNLVAGVASFLSSVPPRHRITPADVFLSVDSLAHIYPLILTLAALYSNATVALTAVAGQGVDLVLATRNTTPTIVVASAETVAKLHNETRSAMSISWDEFTHWLQTRTLIAGRFPREGILSAFQTYKKPAIGTQRGRLRLLYVSERAHVDSQPLSTTELSDLRIFTGARVVYALTAPRVAGAVTQTNIFDYRIGEKAQEPSHFGVPLSSLEIKLVDTRGHKTTDDSDPRGEIVVMGPAVAGGQTALGVVGAIRHDHTLAYAWDEVAGKPFKAVR
ncbi:MAG: hypothetical protein M1835_001626 [Candelina submexicana]|nr:MAG: hypothetical protein M1835_001626 [Candelina submexicana]